MLVLLRVGGGGKAAVDADAVSPRVAERVVAAGGQVAELPAAVPLLDQRDDVELIARQQVAASSSAKQTANPNDASGDVRHVRDAGRPARRNS